MSYVVVRGCSPEVNTAAFGRWLRKECCDTTHTTKVIDRLRAGKRYTVFLDDQEAARFVRQAGQWGLTGVTLHDDDDMSEYPPPPSFWNRVHWCLRRWMGKE